VPLLVHITNEDETESVRRSGIKIGKYREGVYAMPVLPNFIVSNQWLRELKRRVSGSRTLSAIHFRIPDTETVYMGHYSQEHVELTAAEAAGAIMHAEDPLGMEIIIPRAIEAKEIHEIRTSRHVQVAHLSGAVLRQGLRRLEWLGISVPNRIFRRSSTG
jgi:hypothetical protein